ncbi:MAG: hypothetical protein WC648_04765 [Candidatus Paceibacterota bacterium]|jgi:hypothetical protein
METKLFAENRAGISREEIDFAAQTDTKVTLNEFLASKANCIVVPFDYNKEVLTDFLAKMKNKAA